MEPSPAKKPNSVFPCREAVPDRGQERADSSASGGVLCSRLLSDDFIESRTGRPHEY